MFKFKVEFRQSVEQQKVQRGFSCKEEKRPATMAAAAAAALAAAAAIAAAAAVEAAEIDTTLLCCGFLIPQRRLDVSTDGFVGCSDMNVLSENDVGDPAKAFADGTVANGRIAFGLR
jgi:hypothetical protein